MRPKYLVLIAAILAFPSAALAHSSVSHATPFLSGLLHLLTGLDHLLAMLAIGIWAAQRGGKALWLFPAAFVVAMITGGFLGFAHIGLPLLEPAITVSVLILGLLIARAAPLPLAFSLFLISSFALFHGNAHGLEAGRMGGFSYAAGFTLSTALLHLAGLTLGYLIAQQARAELLRYAGGFVAACGAALFFV